MRPEGNPLDLNNFPDEHSRDGKQVHHESFSSGCRKKKSGVKDGNEECGKVYECRFCSLKFCKSQALGGHMNRHRQERETETLNHARQLVFRNDHNLTTQVAPRLGCCQQPIAPAGSYLPAINMGNPITPPKFPRYLSSNSSSINMPHPQQPLSSFPSQYPPVKDCYVGRVLSKMPQYGHHNLNYMEAAESSYTCIGAPVGQALAVGGGKDRSLHNQEEGLNWGRSYSGTQQGNLNPPSVINRFQDGF